MDAAAPHARGRGVELLLAHCAAVARLEHERTPARQRLEEALGAELAARLVGALTAGAPGTARLVA